MLWRDKFASAAVIFLLVAVLCAIFGPALLGEAATKQNLRGRNAPPFSLEQGWLMCSAPTRSAGRCSPASSSRRRTR